MQEITVEQEPEVDVLHETLSAVIRDAFFDARNAGQTMYQAGDQAAARVLAVLQPSMLRLKVEVDTLVGRWESDRASDPTNDWQAGIADNVLRICINELRNAIERAAPTMPTLEAVPGNA